MSEIQNGQRELHDELQAPASVFPGPVSQKMIDELQRYVIMEPEPFVVDLAASKGMYLATVDGQRILDWGGYYGSKLLGHNHPRLYEADYLRRLGVAANNKTANPDFLTPECLAYYRLLHSLAPACMKRESLEVYAVNSGAEAVENMMKYLINLHDEKMLAKNRLVGNRRFIYFDNAFHGRTIFALNVTQLAHDPIITEDFRGLVQGNLQVPFPAWDSTRTTRENRAKMRRSLEIVDECLERYTGEVVGIIVEPIQGAGGQRVAGKQFFQGLSKLAHQYDVYLGFDEVQTAGGQLGSVFAIDQFDLPHPPQAVATGKKFGNGAVYMLNTMDDRGVLDSTWGGTLADMVRFVEEMKIVADERLIEQVPQKAAILVEGLESVAAEFPDLMYNVRGMGLYQGFSMRRNEDAGRLLDISLQRESTLFLGAGPGTIRLRPVLDVSVDDIHEMLAILRRCLAALVSE
jgi:L-lysine 6-transaminase